MTISHTGMSWKLVFGIAALLIFFTPIFPIPRASPNPTNRSPEKPLDVVRAYLKATHAHDFRTAYQYISTSDRNVRDENKYLRSEANFSGFALVLAKTLADDMEVWVVEEKLGPFKVRYQVGYRVPAADEIASQLLDWNADKLNALPATQQQRLLAAVDSVKNRRKMITIEGRETLDLVLEKSGWRIFLDWRSRARILFKAVPSSSNQLDVHFLRNDFLVGTDDPFQIDLTVKNRTDRDLVVKLNHLFEPRRLAENIDMIACGSLAPFRLRPQEVRELSSNYLLRGPVQKSAQVSIIYDFTVASAVAKRKKEP